MLTEGQLPYTGPFYGPSHDLGPSKNRPTIKGLKRGMIRMGILDQELGKETDDFGLELELAVRRFQRLVDIRPASGQYGRQTWLDLRSARVPPGRPNSGQYAMDMLARSYVREDLLAICHPIPKGSYYSICQDLHQTLGIYGNWAIDFCAKAGTRVLAVERARITRLSGRDPAWGVKSGGIFGWSIYYETAKGYRYFSTHYGDRFVREGQIVDVGDAIGEIGNWPGNAHLHLGVTSPLGITDAKKKITSVKNADRV